MVKQEKKTTKYYIELGFNHDIKNYILQSKFFRTYTKALEFAYQLQYVNKDLYIRLMVAEFKNGICKDNYVVRYLK